MPKGYKFAVPYPLLGFVCLPETILFFPVKHDFSQYLDLPSQVVDLAGSADALHPNRPEMITFLANLT